MYIYACILCYILCYALYIIYIYIYIPYLKAIQPHNIAWPARNGPRWTPTRSRSSSGGTHGEPLV